jgi:hypothetical protein
MTAAAMSMQTSWLTRAVGSVGLTSFFSDAGHEVATSVLPSFVTLTLLASAGALVLIEGISDALNVVEAVSSGSSPMTSSATVACGDPVGLVEDRVAVSVIVAATNRVRSTTRLNPKRRWLDASRDPSSVGSRFHLARDALSAPRRLTVTDAPVWGDQARLR